MWWEKVQQATAPTAAWRELTSKGDLREWGELSTFFRAQLRCPSASLVDPLLQQHSLPFPLTHFPQWFLYCTKLRHKYLLCLLSVPFSVFCPLSSMVWEQIQAARRSKAHLHIVWLDLANAYRSLPYLLITFALEFFHIPASLPQELLCLLHNPGSLHQLAPAGGRDSDGPFHLPDPIHSGVWGYPDRQQAGSLQSQSSVKAASDEFWALHGLCYHSSPGSHMHF